MKRFTKKQIRAVNAGQVTAGEIVQALNGNKSLPELVKLRPFTQLYCAFPRRSCSREWLYARQSALCHYCGNWTGFKDWTIDHKTPLARGGDEAPSNKAGCCYKCNHAKSCLTEKEFCATDYMGGKIKLKSATNDSQAQLRTLKLVQRMTKQRMIREARNA